MKATAQVIEEIIKAARKPVPEIVECREYECSDGKFRSIFGIPHGITVTDNFKAHYAYSDGRATYGKRFTSREAAIRAFELNQEERDQEFHAALLDMTDEQIASQANYWLKKR